MKQPGGVDLYAGVKIEWIPHHNPDLSIFGDDGKLEQKIDLSTYDYDALHALFKKHFRPNAAAGAAAAGAAAGRALSAANGTEKLHNDAPRPHPDSIGRAGADTAGDPPPRRLSLSPSPPGPPSLPLLGLALVVGATLVVFRAGAAARRKRTAAWLLKNQEELALAEPMCRHVA